MRILIQVIDPGGVEAAGPALDAMHGIALFQQQLRQVAAVLAGDAGDQRVFAVAHGAIVPCRRVALLRNQPACDLLLAKSELSNAPSVEQGIDNTLLLLLEIRSVCSSTTLVNCYSIW